MKILMLAVSALALLSSPVAAQTAQSPASPPADAGSTATPSKAATSATQPAPSDRMEVAAAHRIIGEDVYAKDGKELGTVEYLLVGVNDGQVRYAVVEPEEGDEDKLVPVPWNAVQPGGSGRHAGLVVDRGHFTKQKTFTKDQLATLTRPEVVTSIYEYWAPVT